MTHRRLPQESLPPLRQPVARHGRGRPRDRAGEFFAMLGPSGSGKTTCLRLIAGFEQPTAGHIEIFGERAEGVPPYRRNVNTVFQDYALFPHLNVLDNVAYWLMVKGVGRPSGREQAEKTRSNSCELAGYGARRPGQLSGGQRQRVALARAHRQPARRCCCSTSRSARSTSSCARSMQEELKSAAEVARHHLRLRHARPGRGAVDGRPRRRVQRRHACSRSARRRTSTSGRSRVSSPISSARRTCSTRTSSCWIVGEKRWASLRPEAIRVVARRRWCLAHDRADRRVPISAARSCGC